MKLKFPTNETLINTTKEIKSFTDSSLKKFLHIDSSIKNESSQNYQQLFSNQDSGYRKNYFSNSVKNLNEGKYINVSSPNTRNSNKFDQKDVIHDLQNNFKNVIQKKIKINTNKNSRNDLQYSLDT